MVASPSATDECPACGNPGMQLISAPRPQYVEQCSSCRSAFFYFGAAEGISHRDQYNVDVSYQRYLEAINEPSSTRRYEETVARLKTMLSDVAQPSLFDIGAGGGDFLARARDHGFRIAGNEVSRPAMEACRERHGIELVLGDDLRGLANELTGFDAVTMWCVIAHVDDAKELLRDVHALLRPGGVLFLSTPRYCSIDRAALLLRWLTRDRYRRAFDRRINRAHRRQYSRRGMEALLRREGFVPVSVEPAIGYGLHMVAYLESLGCPSFLAKPAGKVLEMAARAGLLPRNILNVYGKAI